MIYVTDTITGLHIKVYLVLKCYLAQVNKTIQIFESTEQNIMYHLKCDFGVDSQSTVHHSRSTQGLYAA